MIGFYLKATFGEKVKGFIGKAIDYNPWINWEFHAEKVILHPEYDRGGNLIHT